MHFSVLEASEAETLLDQLNIDSVEQPTSRIFAAVQNYFSMNSKGGGPTTAARGLKQPRIGKNLDVDSIENCFLQRLAVFSSEPTYQGRSAKRDYRPNQSSEEEDDRHH